MSSLSMSLNHLVACFLSTAGLLLSTHALGADTPPNIILIITDDQGYGDLACHGNPHIKTPQLDRLFRESTRLTDFHVSPTCAPTRSALMTGRHEFKNGISHTINERERLRLDAKILPQVLKQAGYTTGIFGKWHLGDEAPYQPEQRGFDEVFIHGAGGIGQTYPGSCGDAPGNSYFNPVIRHNGTFEKTEGYCTDVFFNQATQWINQVRGKSPFFAYIPTNAPHGPYNCPPGSDKPYADAVPPEVARFYGMINNIDTNVGKLLDQLKQWNIERDTLVIFMTDNGSAAGSKVYSAGMRGAKGTPYLGGTRVPGFWRWPGKFSADRDVKQFTCHWDILPTIMEIVGIKPDDQLKSQIEGRSFLPLLVSKPSNDATVAWPNRDFITHVGRWQNGAMEQGKYANGAIRRGNWHLVFKNKNNFELFDLSRDYAETTNVAKDHPELVKDLTMAFDAWWDSAKTSLVNEDVPIPSINPYKAWYWKQYRGPGPNNAPPPADFVFE